MTVTVDYTKTNTSDPNGGGGASIGGAISGADAETALLATDASGDLAQIESAIAKAIVDGDLLAVLESLGLGVYYAENVALSTTATPTKLGTVPDDMRFVSLFQFVTIDATVGTFTPDSDDITVLIGGGSGGSDILFAFFNANVATAGKAAIYGGSFVATGTGQIAGGTDIYCQFNNAGITGGGTATGTVGVIGVLLPS